MQRVLERSRAEPDGASIQFMEIERRQRAIMETFERAVEAEEFQTLGLMLRELLITVMDTLAEFIEFPDASTQPKRGDVKARAALTIATMVPGRSNQALRKHLVDATEGVWEISNWLTHARGADRISAMIACMSCDVAIGNLLLAFRRASEEGPERCPTCKSRYVRTFYEARAAEGYYFQSCEACGWTNHAGM